MTEYQLLLEEAFAAEHDRHVIAGAQQGVLLANAALAHEPFLQTLVGQDLRGHLRRAAVLFRMYEMCRAGDLPFDAQMSRMPRGGGHWVELRSGQFRAHICRTEGPTAFPDDTPTRQDQRATNQFELTLDENVILLRPEIPAESEKYAWLTFGAAADQLTHLCWGMPAARQDEWLARVNILRRAEGTDTPPATSPSPKTVLRFRDHIEETFRNPGPAASEDLDK